ncbi:hypothetical protein F4803DRAFT_485597 [Xylaria telfairii]|nr:hypothetical protein F4803DRAFT_485597 [Xylaria telfairii]
MYVALLYPASPGYLSLVLALRLISSDPACHYLPKRVRTALIGWRGLCGTSRVFIVSPPGPPSQLPSAPSVVCYQFLLLWFCCFNRILPYTGLTSAATWPSDIQLPRPLSIDPRRRLLILQ